MDRHASSATAEVTSNRKKPKPVKSACAECRRRRVKCSGQRPVCQSCSTRRTECSWDTTDGLTKTQDLKAELADVTRRLHNFEILIDAMRSGSNQSATMLLAQLRLGNEAEALAWSIRVHSDNDIDNDIRYDQGRS